MPTLRWSSRPGECMSRPSQAPSPGRPVGPRGVTRRGRQRTPKPWPMAVLCRLGMHQGQWAFVAEGRCTQGRECGRYGSVPVRTEHQREWRYVRARSCGMARECIRCHTTDKHGVRHEWGKTYVVARRWWGGDKEAHRCLRCGEVEEWTVNDGD